jgi:hypothetical protein
LWHAAAGEGGRATRRQRVSALCVNRWGGGNRRCLWQARPGHHIGAIGAPDRVLLCRKHRLIY